MREQEYDRIHNEGGEGYNPIRQARIREEYEAEAARPKSISEQMDAIRHQISIRDCSIARESGTFDQAEVDQLRATLNELEDADNANFLTDWTMDTTKTRRVAWNTMVKSGKFGGKRVDMNAVRRTEKEQGWTLENLRRAIKLYNL